MTDFATAADLEAGWRALTVEEETRAAVLLARASRLIRSRVPSIDDKIADGDIDPDLVGDICCDVVRRAMSARTDGVLSSTNQVGGVSISERFSKAQGHLYLTGSELALLGGRQSLTVSIATPDPD